MATKAEVNAVYVARLIQGVALVTFPAASTIFTEPSQYGLSNAQYGNHVPAAGRRGDHGRPAGREARPR